MKEELISVIVPCYNVSKYVSKCLDSIINQTYKNLEIILVEDCSTDNTLEILEEYVKKDKRIKLIKNKKNGGLSNARNVGIKESKGKYIGFIDSDDYISLDFYEKLYKVIENSDIAVCDFKVIDEDKKIITTSKCYNAEFNKLNLINTGLVASACNKLFKKEVLKYEFAEGKINEDIAVIIPAIVDAKNIGYANTYYYYIQRNNSIQNTVFHDKRFDIFDGVELALKRIDNCENYNEIKDALVFNQLISLFLYVITEISNSKRRKQVLKKYCHKIKKYDIAYNNYLINFINGSGKKRQIYYKILFNSISKGHYSFANSLISIYHKLRNRLKKYVIDKDIDLDDVIEKAKYQSEMKDSNIKISVVIPNYNYGRYMYERLYSILYQNYKIYEIIVLDDCSTDNSKEVIDDILEKITDYVNIKVIYNKKNSGSAFKQWQKGFEHATGDYVWIAEADDYCDSSLISELIKPLENDDNIVISYSDTAFVDYEGAIVSKSVKKQIDIKNTGHWNSNYINDGMKEINEYSYLNNTIANVSSCLIKNGKYDIILKEAGKYHQAGDWLFYVSLLENGSISYNSKTMNYYRLHGNNVSSTMDYNKHLEELNTIYNYYIKKYNLNKNQQQDIKNRIDYLKKTWGLN